MRYDELRIGQAASLQKRFSKEDVKHFAALSGDVNPLHLDEKFANTGPFGSEIVHGLLTSSLFSGIIGTMLPGQGSIYLSQNLNFKKAVFHNELITATCTIVHKRVDKPILTMETICKNENNEVVIEGTAIIKVLDYE